MYFVSTLENMLFYMYKYNYNTFCSLDWTTLSSYRYWSKSFINFAKKFWNWSVLCTFQLFDESQIIEYIDLIDFKAIKTTHPKYSYLLNGKTCNLNKFENQKINIIHYKFEKIIEYIEQNKIKEFETLDWNCISSMKRLSISFIHKYNDKLNKKMLGIHQKLDEFYIRNYFYEISSNVVSQTQLSNLSIEFVLEHKHLLNMKNIKNKKKFWSTNNELCSHWYKRFEDVFDNMYKKTEIMDDTIITLVEKKVYSIDQYYHNIFKYCEV